MNQSTRFAVAVHIATVLAELEGRPVTSTELAGSVNTNPVVVRRVLGQLAGAGLVASERGAHGGSRLARPAGRLTLRELYRAVGEGELCPMHDIGQDSACAVARSLGPVLTGILARAEAAAERELSQITVADVLADVRRGLGKTSKTPRAAAD
jgi:Rrf2 family protein